MNVGIVCALPVEARPLLRAEAVVGKVYSVGPAALLAVSGPGAANARQAADCLLSKGISALISWGLAGGLKPGLAAGDVVLAEELVTEQGHYPVSRSWRNVMRNRLADFTRVCDGTLAHSDRHLTRPDDKRLLHDSSGSIAFDCESAALAKAAKKARIPFLALKVIADYAELRLPAGSDLPDTGDRYLGQVLAKAGARPWQWPALFKMTRCSRIGLDKLNYMAFKLNRDLAPPERRARAQAASA